MIRTLFPVPSSVFLGIPLPLFFFLVLALSLSSPSARYQVCERAFEPPAFCSDAVYPLARILANATALFDAHASEVYNSTIESFGQCRSHVVLPSLCSLALRWYTCATIFPRCLDRVDLDDSGSFFGLSPCEPICRRIHTHCPCIPSDFVCFNSSRVPYCTAYGIDDNYWVPPIAFLVGAVVIVLLLCLVQFVWKTCCSSSRNRLLPSFVDVKDLILNDDGSDDGHVVEDRASDGLDGGLDGLDGLVGYDDFGYDPYAIQ